MSRCPALGFLTSLFSIIFGIAPAASAAENEEAKQLDWIVVDTLRPLFETVSANPWIQSFLVILITVTCASLFTWLIFKFILAITDRTQFLFDDQIARLVRPPIYYTLVVIGLTAGIPGQGRRDRGHQPGHHETVVEQVLADARRAGDGENASSPTSATRPCPRGWSSG